MSKEPKMHRHHFHGYAWTGTAAALKQDRDRRPSSDGLFVTNKVPPFRMCDWLLKTASSIDGTWKLEELEGAVDWMRRQYRTHQDSFWLPDQEAKIGLNYRADSIRRDLGNGVDVQWAFWLQHERYTSMGVVCCTPNKHAGYRCPLR